jgi:beta-glucosidase
MYLLVTDLHIQLLNIRLDTNKNKYGENDVIKLSFNLKNSGSVAAEEVVQAYIHRINPSVEWPYKELKAFARVSVEPGESQVVKLDIPVKNLRYWNESLQAWDNDLCDLEIQVGASAGDIILKETVTLK